MAIEWKELTVNQFKIVSQAMMIVSDPFLDAAIKAVYKLQTEEEKYKDKSIENNGVGFSKVDAEVLGNIAEKLINGKQLTKGERAKARNKMQKYWRQLLMLSREKWEREAKQEQVRIKQIEQSRQIERDISEYELNRCKEEGIPCNFGICSECKNEAKLF